jgi:hypothetical protein
MLDIEHNKTIATKTLFLRLKSCTCLGSFAYSVVITFLRYPQQSTERSTKRCKNATQQRIHRTSLEYKETIENYGASDRSTPDEA